MLNFHCLCLKSFSLFKSNLNREHLKCVNSFKLDWKLFILIFGAFSITIWNKSIKIYLFFFGYKTFNYIELGNDEGPGAIVVHYSTSSFKWLHCVWLNDMFVTNFHVWSLFIFTLQTFKWLPIAKNIKGFGLKQLLNWRN